jgi:glycosyltransferase involved in cell wall biosynthesis
MRLLIISHDTIGARMAGPGIRYWELARVLAGAADVTLAAPAPIDLAPQGFALADYAPTAPAGLAALSAAADLVLANGHVLAFYPALAAVRAPLILDLYDPVPIENLELFCEAAPAQRTTQSERDAALLRAQLLAGDYFLCATERQRDLYLGALLALGRVTPALYDQDPLLRNLLDVVSFGLPTEPPVHTAPALRAVLPGVDAATNLLLWSGGLWDWMDPLSVIRAMPAVLERHPQACLVFLSGAHPGGAAPMRRPDEARALAAELNLLGGAVQFYDQWVPYAYRANALLEADLLVSLGRPGLESAYAAVRSRFLDHLWAGRASLVSAGDAASDLVSAHQLGLVVPPGDVAATAAAIVALLDNPDERAACAARARALAQAYTWERVAAPLRTFCLQPRRTRPPAAPARPQPARKEEPMSDPDPHPLAQQQQALVRRLESLWQLSAGAAGGLTDLARRPLLRLLAPLLAEQREFNGALVRLFYLEQQRAAQDAAQISALVAQTLSLSRQISDLHRRIDTVVDFDAELNDRLARLNYTVGLLNDAVAAGDEASARLAAELGALKTAGPRDE